MITPRYNYAAISRTSENGKRFYLTPDGGKLPSVTTILDRTSDKTFLREWRKRVGNEEAARVTKVSTGLGTTMHKMLENYILEDQMPDPKSNIFARAMALRVIREGMANIDEYWGTEVSLYYPGLYAGTTDCVGVWRGKPAIIDFKNSRKPKRREWIGGYLEQLVAYGMAHNEVYGTDIQTGVVMLCTHDAEYQEFVLEGEDWQHTEREWARRVGHFYDPPRGFEIVRRGTGDQDGMRGPAGQHMLTEGIRPGDAGWIGNPFKWAGNGGDTEVTVEEAIDQFREAFLQRVEADRDFRLAVLALRGQRVGYYKPGSPCHLDVIQEWLHRQPL